MGGLLDGLPPEPKTGALARRAATRTHRPAPPADAALVEAAVARVLAELSPTLDRLTREVRQLRVNVADLALKSTRRTRT